MKIKKIFSILLLFTGIICLNSKAMRLFKSKKKKPRGTKTIELKTAEKMRSEKNFLPYPQWFNEECGKAPSSEQTFVIGRELWGKVDAESALAIRYNNCQVIKKFIRDGTLNILKAVKETHNVIKFFDRPHADRTKTHGKYYCGLTEELIKQDPNLANMRDEKRNTLLHITLRYNTRKPKLFWFSKENKKHSFALNTEVVATQALIKNNYNMIELLVKNGTDINAQNQYGNTPLHLAIIRHNNSHGSPRLEENFGNFMSDRIVVDYLIEHDQKIIELLVQNGANVSVKNNNGDTSLDLAIAAHDDNDFYNHCCYKHRGLGGCPIIKLLKKRKKELEALAPNGDEERLEEEETN